MMILFPAFPFIYYIFISVLREYFGANNCNAYVWMCVSVVRAQIEIMMQNFRLLEWMVLKCAESTSKRNQKPKPNQSGHRSLEHPLCAVFSIYSVMCGAFVRHWNGVEEGLFHHLFASLTYNLCHSEMFAMYRERDGERRKTTNIAQIHTHRHTHSSSGGRNAIFECKVFGVKITSREKDYSLFNGKHAEHTAWALSIYFADEINIYLRQIERDSHT